MHVQLEEMIIKLKKKKKRERDWNGFVYNKNIFKWDGLK